MQGLGAETRLTRFTRRAFVHDGPAPHGSGPFVFRRSSSFSPGSAPRPETGAVGTGRRRQLDRTRQTGVPRVRKNLAAARPAFRPVPHPTKRNPALRRGQVPLGSSSGRWSGCIVVMRSKLLRVLPVDVTPLTVAMPTFPSLHLFRPSGREVHSGCRVRLPWCGLDRPGRPGAQHPQSVAQRDNLRAKSREVLYYQ